MKRASMFVLTQFAAAAALVVSSGAYAGGTEDFDLTFSGSGFSGALDLTAVSLGNGEFDVISATGTVNGLAASLYSGTACTASTCQVLTTGDGHTIFTSPPNASNIEVNFDNVLYTGSSTALNGGLFADDYGLAFSTSAGVANVYGEGSYQYTDSTQPSLNGFPISANLVVPAVPEPSTYLMMLFGLAAISYAVKRRTRTVSAAAVPMLA